MSTASRRTTIKYSSRRRRLRKKRNLTSRTPEDTPQGGRPTAHARCMAMRASLTSERAHNNQPATNSCQTARSCKIDHTPSLVTDAALHLLSTTNTYLSDSVGPSECHLIRLLRRMRLINKFLSPTCAPGLGDVDTYFFFEKIFRSEIRICVTVT